MKKETTGLDFVVRRDARGFDALKNVRGFDALGSRCVRLGLVAAMGASLALNLSDSPRAQQPRFRETPVRVKSVTTNGNVVSIDADGSLNHAQTWQDPNGDFHVVLVNGEATAGVGRGVRVGRVGNSLELVVPVRAGANVTVQPRGNRLDLVVSGGGAALSVENFPVEQRKERERRGQSAARQESEAPREQAAPEQAQSPKAEQKRRAESSSYEFSQALTQPPASNAQTAAQQRPSTAQPAQTAAPAGDVLPPLAQPANASQEPAQADPAAQAPTSQSGGGGFDLLSFLFSLPSMLVLLSVALAGAFAIFMRRRRDPEGEGEAGQKTQTKAVVSEALTQAKTQQAFQAPKGDRRKSSIAVPFDRRTSGAGAEDEATRRAREMEAEARNNGNGAQHARGESKASAAPAVLHGSYRIDQEVARLVAGEPHSIEILASRASDDRRAVETSLLKALRAPETDEDGQRRARQALEDYGFVARSCASLLLGSETFERVSAARTLADMKSSQALSFLTEALYDPDPVVRNECVQSLGALGLPSAIGALLDVARRHQDVPASILGPALTACSVESLELGWETPSASRSFVQQFESEESLGGDARMIVPAPEGYEPLPEFIEDESLSSALARVQGADAESRVTAATQLAQFQVRRAVAALAAAACGDAESAVRSAAVNSLGLINHESVLAHVIIALADEAREVRAAAARALSRLSFDRADAYVRLAETADARTVREVARACVKAGLAAQAVARLTSEDRRQAFESFSLLSLCVCGGQAAPVVEAVEGHRDIDARMACIQLLGESRDARVREQLQRLADSGSIPERVRRSIRETVDRSALVPVAVESE